MQVAETIQAVRHLVKSARQQGKRIGFVPTMGAFHIGHAALIDEAVKRCGFVVVSIFVNPTQFGPGEDFEKYPRPLENDLDICRGRDVDVVFVPTAEEMYPQEILTWVNADKLTKNLCGRFRPGHFRGVATVCAKLFNIVCPDAAFFGWKDAQQAVVIQRMVADLNMPLEIVLCPTVRDSDGLALSSRNQYLSSEQRRDAMYIYKSLQKAQELIAGGQRDVQAVVGQIKDVLNQPGTIEVEYVSIVNAADLEELQQIEGKVLIAVAAKIGRTRLIDNILVDTAER
ncbi:MAG: pantoate--beta-alanine ligase [Planctomycetota bacterium]|jgi:pantoate--beta-alanine ligase